MYQGCGKTGCQAVSSVSVQLQHHINLCELTEGNQWKEHSLMCERSYTMMKEGRGEALGGIYELCKWKADENSLQVTNSRKPSLPLQKLTSTMGKLNENSRC